MQQGPTIWDQIRLIAEAVISAGGAVAAVVATWKLIPRAWDHGILVARLNSAETAAREYRIACEEQQKSIQLLEERNAQLRAENDAQEREALDFAVAAGTFIITLVSGLKKLTDRLQEAGIADVDPLPPIPDSLAGAVALARRKLSEKMAQEASQGEAPFSSAPREGRKG